MSRPRISIIFLLIGICLSACAKTRKQTDCLDARDGCSAKVVRAYQISFDEMKKRLAREIGSIAGNSEPDPFDHAELEATDARTVPGAAPYPRSLLESYGFHEDGFTADYNTREERLIISATEELHLRISRAIGIAGTKPRIQE